MGETHALIETQAAAWGVKLGKEQWILLDTFAGLLHSYKEANVIGTKDLQRISLDHVLDSLSCLLFAPLKRGSALVDVGSGGGLPAIPLSIANPQLATVMVESTGKKVRFLQHAIESLSLRGVEVVDTRAEEFARGDGRRGGFDFSTSRAVARLSVVLEYCVPLLREGGHAISMKARLEPDELNQGRRAAKELGAEISDVIDVPMLSEIGQKERRLVVVEKVRETPVRYPRGVGVPAKRPLGAL